MRDPKQMVWSVRYYEKAHGGERWEDKRVLRRLILGTDDESLQNNTQGNSSVQTNTAQAKWDRQTDFMKIMEVMQHQHETRYAALFIHTDWRMTGQAGMVYLHDHLLPGQRLVAPACGAAHQSIRGQTATVQLQGDIAAFLFKGPSQALEARLLLFDWCQDTGGWRHVIFFHGSTQNYMLITGQGK